MTEEEYYIMKIRQLIVLNKQEQHIRTQIDEIRGELEHLSNKEFSRLKALAEDGQDYTI